MYLIAGLGNPGPKYHKNRHNVGFLVVQKLYETQGVGAFSDHFNGRFAKIRIADQNVGLLKPETYMNLSGQSVQQAMHFYKIPIDELIIVHDDVDLPFGSIRVKLGGGTAGHKGIRSVIDCMGSADFVRLRVGIGRPQTESVKAFVLSDFDANESVQLPDVLDHATDALLHIIQYDVQEAMNRFNSRIDQKSENH